MLLPRLYINRPLAGLLLILFFSSCAGYNKQVAVYYHNLREGNYEKAATSLDNNKLLKKIATNFFTCWKGVRYATYYSNGTAAIVILIKLIN